MPRGQTIITGNRIVDEKILRRQKEIHNEKIRKAKSTMKEAMGGTRKPSISSDRVPSAGTPTPRSRASSATPTGRRSSIGGTPRSAATTSPHPAPYGGPGGSKAETQAQGEFSCPRQCGMTFRSIQRAAKHADACTGAPHEVADAEATRRADVRGIYAHRTRRDSDVPVTAPLTLPSRPRAADPVRPRGNTHTLPYHHPQHPNNAGHTSEASHTAAHVPKRLERSMRSFSELQSSVTERLVAIARTISEDGDEDGDPDAFGPTRVSQDFDEPSVSDEEREEALARLLDDIAPIDDKPARLPRKNVPSRYMARPPRQDQHRPQDPTPASTQPPARQPIKRDSQLKPPAKPKPGQAAAGTPAKHTASITHTVAAATTRTAATSGAALPVARGRPSLPSPGDQRGTQPLKVAPKSRIPRPKVYGNRDQQTAMAKKAQGDVRLAKKAQGDVRLAKKVESDVRWSLAAVNGLLSAIAECTEEEELSSPSMRRSKVRLSGDSGPNSCSSSPSAPVLRPSYSPSPPHCTGDDDDDDDGDGNGGGDGFESPNSLRSPQEGTSHPHPLRHKARYLTDGDGDGDGDGDVRYSADGSGVRVSVDGGGVGESLETDALMTLALKKLDDAASPDLPTPVDGVLSGESPSAAKSYVSLDKLTPQLPTLPPTSDSPGATIGLSSSARDTRSPGVLASTSLRQSASSAAEVGTNNVMASPREEEASGVHSASLAETAGSLTLTGPSGQNDVGRRVHGLHSLPKSGILKASPRESVEQAANFGTMGSSGAICVGSFVDAATDGVGNRDDEDGNGSLGGTGASSRSARSRLLHSSRYETASDDDEVCMSMEAFASRPQLVRTPQNVSDSQTPRGNVGVDESCELEVSQSPSGAVDATCSEFDASQMTRGDAEASHGVGDYTVDFDEASMPCPTTVALSTNTALSQSDGILWEQIEEARRHIEELRRIVGEDDEDDNDEGDYEFDSEGSEPDSQSGCVRSAGGGDTMVSAGELDKSAHDTFGDGDGKCEGEGASVGDSDHGYGCDDDGNDDDDENNHDEYDDYDDDFEDAGSDDNAEATCTLSEAARNVDRAPVTDTRNPAPSTRISHQSLNASVESTGSVSCRGRFFDSVVVKRAAEPSPSRKPKQTEAGDTAASEAPNEHTENKSSPQPPVACDPPPSNGQRHPLQGILGVRASRELRLALKQAEERAAMLQVSLERQSLDKSGHVRLHGRRSQSPSMKSPNVKSPVAHAKPIVQRSLDPFASTDDEMAFAEYDKTRPISNLNFDPGFCASPADKEDDSLGFDGGSDFFDPGPGCPVQAGSLRGGAAQNPKGLQLGLSASFGDNIDDVITLDD